MSQEEGFTDKLKDAIFGLFYEDDKEKVKITKEQEKQILKLAQAKGGVLTVNEVVVGTSLSLEEAEKCLNFFASKGHAEMNVTDSGVIVYEFYGIMPSKKHEKTYPKDDQPMQLPKHTPPPITKPVRHIKPFTPEENQDDQININPEEKPTEEETYIITSEQKTAETPDWIKNRKKKNW
ncbi:MAG: hypothetical protein OEV44_05820 [Spirochaetota bacterium]|nr:hypothetical protein [Spirochaetota bacterium]